MFSKYRKAYLARLKVLARRFNQQLERSGRSPTNEQVHDLRVTIRRIRSAIRFVKGNSQRNSLNTLDTKLKKLGKNLGRRRELDVALDDAIAFHLDDLNNLREIRKKARTQVAQALVRHKRKRLLLGLEKAVKEIERQPALNFLNTFSELRKNLLPWLDLSIRGKNQIHSFRITMKKSRYTLEAIGLSVEPLGKLQDHLGRAHDMEVLTKLIGHSPHVRKLENRETSRAQRLARPAIIFVLKQTDLIMSHGSGHARGRAGRTRKLPKS